MRKDKPITHLGFLGALCGGLLLMGIGVGVQLAEVSALSYGGEVLVENTPHIQRMVVSLSPHAEYINLKSDDGRFASQIRESYQIQVQESVDPGTAVVEFRYEGTPVIFTYDSDTSQVPLLQSIYFSWLHENETYSLMTWKDALLEDLKQGQIGDYKPWELREVIISVNPDDADRISVF